MDFNGQSIACNRGNSPSQILAGLFEKFLKIMLTVEEVEKAMKAELEEEEIEVMEESFYGKFHVKVDDKHEYDVYVGEDVRKKAVAELIEDNLFTFTPSFLRGHLKIRLSEEIVEKLTSVESSELIKELLLDFDEFVIDVIAVNGGAGSFLGHYDGEEHEVEGEFNDNTIYYYRV